MKTMLSFFFGTRRRILLFALSWLILLSILFCSVVLPFLQQGSVVLSYKGLRLREGVFHYLYSFYRYKLPASFEEIKDTDDFWHRSREDGKTNEEYYGEIALNLVCQTLALARIYDQKATLTTEERAEIKNAISEVVTTSYLGGGSKKSFNKNAEKFGFTYRDFQDATTILYKAITLQSTLYGQNGGLMQEGDLQQYLSQKYAHVLIIFVRTENKFLLNDQGQYIPDGNGGYQTEPMPEEEKAQQLAKIEEIKAQLTDGTTKEEFMQLFTSYNNDAQATQRLGSYYFSEGNAYTTAYEKVFPSVSETALSLAIGEVGIATSSIGTHFIFRTEAGDAPYNDKNYQEFFEDFRTRAATYLYQQLLQEGLAGVKVKNQAFLDGLSFGDTQPNNSLMIAYFRHYQVSISQKQ